MEIDIAGIDKAKLLAALFNASRPLGLGFLQPGARNNMTDVEAREILAISDDAYFDYLRGRVMKIDLNGDKVQPAMYDRDNGPGAVQAVVNTLRAQA